jgi:hypothetical protein
VSQGPLSKGQVSQGRKPASALEARTKRKRRRLVLMCFGVFSVAASIAGVAALTAGFRTTSSPTGEMATSRADIQSVGTIVLPSGANGCQHRMFDNRTGQISESGIPCQDSVAVDANGVPIPLGTVHTLNAISKSFKRSTNIAD